jgi:hypothetical protein
MEQVITTVIIPLLGFFFGGYSVIALIVERKKRAAESEHAKADALTAMQEAYARFVSDNEQKLSGMSSEIFALKKQAEELTALLDKERANFKILQGKYNNLMMAHGKLKKAFEESKYQTSK